jgi:hypothetical protein
MGGGEFSISGLPWLESGEVNLIPPPQRIVFAPNTSAIGPLDSAAHLLLHVAQVVLERPAGSRDAIISGHNLERCFQKPPKRRPRLGIWRVDDNDCRARSRGMQLFSICLMTAGTGRKRT